MFVFGISLFNFDENIFLRGMEFRVFVFLFACVKTTTCANSKRYAAFIISCFRVLLICFPTWSDFQRYVDSVCVCDCLQRRANAMRQQAGPVHRVGVLDIIYVQYVCILCGLGS